MTSQQIQSEIEQQCGFVPPFFAAALGSPEVLENLWRQTVAAGEENPFSTIFKEKLGVLLSRFCTVPYCLAVHCAALRPLGVSALDILALLETPESAEPLVLGILPVPSREGAAAPEAGSPLEATLLACAAAVFSEQADAEPFRAELARLLAPDLYSQMVAYLAYVKTCHLWTEAHPEISYGAGRRAEENLALLLTEQPALARFLQTGRIRGTRRERVAEEALAAAQSRAGKVIREDEARLQDTQTRLQATLAAGGIATWTWDLRTNRIVADAALVRLLSLAPEDAAGGPPEAYFQAIHPDDRSRVMALLADIAVRGGAYETEYRVVLPDGSQRWLAMRGRVERDAEGTAVALLGVVQDVTERAEQERRARFVAELVERARGMSDPDAVIADAVRSVGEFLGVSRCVFADIDIEADICTISPDWRTDASVISIEGTFAISAFGAFVVAEYKAGRTAVVDDVHADPVKAPPESLPAYDAIGVRAYITAPVVHSARLVSAIAVHSAVPRHWKPEEIALLQIVVERTWLTVELLRQERAIALEAEETRQAHERTAEILESITDAFFTLDSDWNFTYVNAEAERVLFRPRADLLSRNVWEEFPAAVGSTFEREYRRAMNERVAVSFEEYFPPLEAWFVVRAYPTGSGISVFFQDVTLRRNAEAERERLQAERQAQVERDALISRIGLALRDSTNAEAARETAAGLLGQALGADRCYFALYDLVGGTVRISQDWHRPDLPSVAGLYPFVNTAAMFRELYRDSRTSVIADAYTSALSAQTRANMNGLQIRSRVSVAVADADGLAATLTAAMADGPREWTAEEVALMEAAATQLRIGVEAARIQQREHRIATQLQEALQPEPPSSVPGLSVGRFTRPALDEAQVGGDFYDLFALDKTLYAVVIGDVSGKGLAAAQQLALIRNSLRTTLYLTRQPARAAAALNSIVTAHDLLVGFVTAIVAVYDASTGRIVYCCCGHEPGLVRRAGGAVEALRTTGSPLGVAENADYTEEAIALTPGDSLLLYTDGISESGPSRRAMLGTEGLSQMLSALAPGPDAQADAESLVAEVSAFTNGVFRDDVAVLMVRRQ